MNVQRSSGKHTISGDFNRIEASGDATINQTGDSRVVWSYDHAAVTVHGRVNDVIRARGASVVLAHGKQKLVTTEDTATIAVCGSPSEVVAKDASAITIFGEPKMLHTRSKGVIRVISLVNDYTPESESTVEGGKVGIYRPGINPHFPKNGLGLDLEALFGQPTTPEEGAQYAAYIALLSELSGPN
jgi:hypothetical protein